MNESTDSRKAAVAELFSLQADDSDFFIKHRYQMMYRPMYGGIFGSGRYELASYATERNRLHHVMFMVIEPRSWLALSVADTKQDAIDRARRLLAALQEAGFLFLWEHLCGQRESAQRRAADERAVMLRAGVRATREKKPRVASIPKRRREIFDASEGKCHYCGTALTLDGRWHVEHKTPKALGGDNAPGNLVASCAPCNHDKRDTTDQEYLAKRAAKGKA